jgi:hypothetical protein
MTLKQKKLSEKAMLVSFTISTWTGRVKDSKVSNEITTNKQADSDAGAWWTYLIPKSALKDVNRTAAQCRVAFWKFTLPWQDSGNRILPSALFMDYTNAMREAKNDYNEAVSDFLKIYPELITSAQARLGKLSQNKTLPSIDVVGSKFGYHTNVLPLPASPDFRFNELSGDELKELNAQSSNSINNITSKAMSSIWDRFNELVDKVESTLTQPDKIFRDTLITNLSDFCTLLPKMNIADDAKLEEMRKVAIDKLTNLKPSSLREDKKERKDAAKAAKDVLAKLKEYSI